MFTRFPPNSRYYQSEIKHYEQEEGEDIPYLERRFLPQPENLTLLQEHPVTQGERLDHIATQHLGDPLLFWRIADANAAMNPSDLVEPLGRMLRISMPEGF